MISDDSMSASCFYVDENKYMLFNTHRTLPYDRYPSQVARPHRCLIKL